MLSPGTRPYNPQKRCGSGGRPGIIARVGGHLGLKVLFPPVLSWAMREFGAYVYPLRDNTGYHRVPHSLIADSELASLLHFRGKAGLFK